MFYYITIKNQFLTHTQLISKAKPSKGVTNFARCKELYCSMKSIHHAWHRWIVVFRVYEENPQRQWLPETHIIAKKTKECFLPSEKTRFRNILCVWFLLIMCSSKNAGTVIFRSMSLCFLFAHMHMCFSEVPGLLTAEILLKTRQQTQCIFIQRHDDRHSA